jgi:hypothetical protein
MKRVTLFGFWINPRAILKFIYDLLQEEFIFECLH